MTIYCTDNVAGTQAWATVSSTQLHPLGTVRRFQDSTAASGTQGGIEAIYLQGVANTRTGMLVTYNTRDGSTTLVPTSNKNKGWPIAVATCANNTTGSWAWYQIGGVAIVRKDAADFGTAASVYASSANAGYITPFAASGSGAALLGAITVNSASVASTTSTIYVEIDRPHLQGAVTS